MKIDVEKLVHALELVKPAIGSEQAAEQSSCFAFLGKAVVTYNDEYSIMCPLPTDVGISGAVRAEELHQFLHRVDAKKVEVKAADGELRLLAGKAKAGLPFQAEAKFPSEILKEEERDWKELPVGFLAALQRVRLSCSLSMGTFVLSCVHVNTTSVEASDNYRITQVDVQEIPFAPFLISRRIVGDLVKYPIAEIAASAGWVHFRTKESVVFSCRMHSGSYPNIAEHLKVEGGFKLKFPSSMAKVLDRAAVFSFSDAAVIGAAGRGAQSMIDVSVAEDGGVVVKTANDNGWFEESIVIEEYKGKAFGFSVNPAFLLEALEEMSDCVVMDNRVLFRGDNWRHAVALLAGKEK